MSVCFVVFPAVRNEVIECEAVVGRNKVDTLKWSERMGGMIRKQVAAAVYTSRGHE